MKKKAWIIVLSLIIFVLISFSIAFGIRYIKYNVPRRYSKLISTKNIEYVETNIDFSVAPKYDYNTYRILNETETKNFIESINDSSLKYIYWGTPNGWKGVYYNTFKIHYTDGRVTILDENHVEKFDKLGKSTYLRILEAYNCEIYKNMYE